MGFTTQESNVFSLDAGAEFGVTGQLRPAQTNFCEQSSRASITTEIVCNKLWFLL
jgi:hypothetical protein